MLFHVATYPRSGSGLAQRPVRLSFGYAAASAWDEAPAPFPRLSDEEQARDPARVIMALAPAQPEDGA